MTSPKPNRNSRRLVWAGLLVGLLVGSYFLPLFHVVPLKQARQESAAAAFDAAGFVETLWGERLLKSADRAVDADELLAAFRANTADAVERFGRRLGLSAATSYLVSGRGRIVAVEDRSVTIALSDRSHATVVIETGPVFGNAIRDGSGLLDVSEFPNSQDFNAISSEINRRVEERVLPILREKAAVGAAVRFLGCTEIANPDADVPPLRIVPVAIEFP